MDVFDSGLSGDRIVNPIVDAGFKLIFGREEVSERLIINLLNSLFAGDKQLGNITEVRFTNTERQNEYIHGRSLRYDIRCVTSSGLRFIVEMQKADQHNFTARSQYYVSRDIAVQGFKGKDEANKGWDFSLMPVVGVFFCNFHLKELGSKPITYGRILDEETHQPIGDFQRYVYIQLPCFIKGKDECDTNIDKWIYNIKNMGTMQTVAFKTENDIFEYLESVSNVAALPPDERDLYESALMYARDYNAQMKFAKDKAMEEGLAEGRARGLAEGRARGMAEGRARGMAEGRARGIAEGRAEGRAEGEYEEKVRMARKMRMLGLPVSTISEVTGMTDKEIAEI